MKAVKSLRTIVLLAVIIFLSLDFNSACAQGSAGAGKTSFQKGYATVNGLKMYYEVHGSGEPLVVLHGAYMTIEGPVREIASAMSKNRQVIAVELQGHGRTGDINRPLTCEHMADDVAALLKYLKIGKADVFGYSMGGGVTLQMAIRHPALVRKIVVVSATYNSKGMYPELLAMIPQMTPEMFEGTPWKAGYDTLAPDPKKFPVLMEKLKKLDQSEMDWKAESIKAIKAPAMVMIGDSDATKPEHAVEMFRLFGGGVMGDLAGLPNAQLAVLPATTHIGIMSRLSWVIPMTEAFLAEPVKTAQQ